MSTLYVPLIFPYSFKLHIRDGRTDATNVIRGSVRPSVCHESQRRRHGVTAAIAVDVVAVRVCPSARFKDGQSVRLSVS